MKFKKLQEEVSIVLIDIADIIVNPKKKMDIVEIYIH